MIFDKSRLLKEYGVSPSSIKLLRMIEAMLPADLRALFLELLLDLCSEVEMCTRRSVEYELREQARAKVVTP